MRQRSKYVLRATLAALIVGGGLVVMPTAPAAATTIPSLQWAPVPMPDLPRPQHAITGPDGGVTFGCSFGSGTTAGFTSYANSGVVAQTASASADPSPTGLCAGTSAVGADGTVYTDAYNSRGYALVVAYRGGVQQWAYAQPCGDISALTVGTNGNIYMVATGGSCSRSHLIGLTPAGSVVADTQIMRNVALSGALSAYDGGVAVRYVDGVGFFNYSSMLQSENTVPLGSFDGAPFTTADTGWAMVPVMASTRPVQCQNDSNIVGSINAYGVAGLIWSQQLPACSHVYGIRPMYNGGAVALIDVQDAVDWTKFNKELYAVGPTTGQQPLWTASVPTSSGNDTYSSFSFTTDLNGNVAVMGMFQRLDNGYRYPGVTFSVLDGFNGTPVAHAEIAGGYADGYGFRPTTLSDAVPAIANGVAYVPLTHCGDGWCDYNTTQLYAVSIPRLTMDYPRGAVLNSGAPWKNYVAMGDSFSSGEGVEPFDPATDPCHKSVNAYGRLMHDNAAFRTRLAQFVACSGDTTSNVTGTGQHGEAPQVSVLNANTDMVTITIGGNDVQFKKFAATCLLADCAPYRAQYLSLVNGMGSTLSSLYDAILAHAPNAKIYVLGYPMLLPGSGCSQTDANMQALSVLAARAAANDPLAIATLTTVGQGQSLDPPDMVTLLRSGSVQFSNDEQALIHDFVTDLNAKISATVASKGGRMQFIDPTATDSPFMGHELCTNNPYFNSLVVGTAPEYSFHPNSQGQAAYRQLLVAHI